MTNTTYNIFKKGSRTYFYSSLFFPKQIRDDVFSLYAFVRIADDYVDCVPQKAKEFEDFGLKFNNAWKGEVIGDEVIDGFVAMAKKVVIKKEWIDEFLGAMESDLNRSSKSYRTYTTYKDLEKYMYGSAEVIGLMMAKIMKLPEAAMPSAAKLGQAMQYVNFIRDVSEDIELGRQYLPNLPEKSDPAHDKYIRDRLDEYFKWDMEAREGFGYIPKRFLIPIKTAAAMYRWTASQIAKNPQVIYKKKVKPSIVRIICTAIISSFY